jgi:hypothetical protein
MAACTGHQKERLEEVLAPQEKAVSLRNRHIAAESLHQPRGPFDFTLEEVPVTLAARGAPVYFLKGNGLPMHERFLLASFDPLKETTVAHVEFEVLEGNNLLIITPKGNEIAEEIPLVLKDLLQGQAIDLALISKTKNTCTRTSFTPLPLEDSIGDADFSLMLTHRKGTHFALEGHYLLPGERITVTEYSGPQMTRHALLADQEGNLSIPIEPIVLGKLGGEASVVITRASGDARIDYFWGGRLEFESKKITRFHPLLFAANREESEIDFLALLPQIDRQLYL